VTKLTIRKSDINHYEIILLCIFWQLALWCVYLRYTKHHNGETCAITYLTKPTVIITCSASHQVHHGLLEKRCPIISVAGDECVHITRKSEFLNNFLAFKSELCIITNDCWEYSISSYHASYLLLDTHCGSLKKAPLLHKRQLFDLLLYVEDAKAAKNNKNAVATLWIEHATAFEKSSISCQTWAFHEMLTISHWCLISWITKLQESYWF
jgi:hypothetical protein